MEKDSWRVIQTPPASGTWNMAVDEAILEAVGQGLVPPTLRLFAWEPPCLSLGYSQSISDVDMPALKAFGWGLVRRPTGGRAILHTDELTYSVITPLQEPRVHGSILESYQRLSEALLYALHSLSLPAKAEKEYGTPGTSQPVGPVCFEVPSNYEITVSGKKLIGSAQARRREGVLQHGSLPLVGDLRRITDVLVFPSPAERALAGERLLQRATTVEACLGRSVSFSEAAAAFVRGFERALQLNLREGELTDFEKTRAQELDCQKYSHSSWTERV